MTTKSGQELKEMLSELYRYYFCELKQVEAEDRETIDEYKVGKFSGGVDAVSAIYLALYGGREMMQLWTDTLNAHEVGAEQNDQTTGD